MRLQRVGLLCEGGKRYSYWCMLFLPCSLFYFSKSHFTLSLFSLLSLSILYLDYLSYYPCSFYGTVPIYIPHQVHVISLFYSHCSPTICVHCKHSLESPITLFAIWVQPPLPLHMCNVFSLFHCLFHNKLSPISLCHVPFSPLWMVKPWVSFNQSL